MRIRVGFRVGSRQRRDGNAFHTFCAFFFRSFVHGRRRCPPGSVAPRAPSASRRGLRPPPAGRRPGGPRASVRFLNLYIILGALAVFVLFRLTDAHASYLTVLLAVYIISRIYCLLFYYALYFFQGLELLVLGSQELLEPARLLHLSYAAKRRKLATSVRVCVEVVSLVAVSGRPLPLAARKPHLFLPLAARKPNLVFPYRLPALTV